MLFAETRVEDPPPAMDESRARAELFHTAGPSALGADASSTDVVPERRSAASLRAKYGRPESSAATDAACARERRETPSSNAASASKLQDTSARSRRTPRISPI